MTVIRSNRVVVGEEVRPASVRFEEGVIVGIGDYAADHDFGDMVVMPGLVDSHVHVNEPGRTEWEGFESATRAAAVGGTTTIVDMPLNSIPPTVDVRALEEKRAAATGKLSVDVAFWGGLIPGSDSELVLLVEEGVCGFKSFLVDSGVAEFPPVTLELLGEVLPELADLGVPALIHAEDPAQIFEIEGDPRDYDGYLASRPAVGEAAAVGSLIRLVGESEARVHVLHVSSLEAVAVLAESPGAISGETCPHYLVFEAGSIADGATSFKCAPPIRATEHREALWQGLIEGALTMVVSDHSPAPGEIKSVDEGSFRDAWGGIGSLQLRLPATWTGAQGRDVELTDLSRWLSTEPARLAGLDDRKGAIGVGLDADFVIWDPSGVTVVSGHALEHRHAITPYEGMTLQGRVEATILHGEIVFEGAMLADRRGRMLRRR
jgi:allantoinase